MRKLSPTLTTNLAPVPSTTNPLQERYILETSLGPGIHTDESLEIRCKPTQGAIDWPIAIFHFDTQFGRVYLPLGYPDTIEGAKQFVRDVLGIPELSQ